MVFKIFRQKKSFKKPSSEKVKCNYRAVVQHLKDFTLSYSMCETDNFKSQWVSSSATLACGYPQGSPLALNLFHVNGLPFGHFLCHFLFKEITPQSDLNPLSNTSKVCLQQDSNFFFLD